jgi:hypothetical protein
MQIDVEAINCGRKEALLTSGDVVAITDFLLSGEKCDPEIADMIICGDDDHGWFCVELADYEYGNFH